MKPLYFLAGLPRSGSTLLGSLLNQHPEIYVSPTSPLGDILADLNASLNKVSVQFTFDEEIISYNVYHAILSNFYNHISEPYIIDKNRFWTQNISTLKLFVDYTPKIIAPYRPISEILTSYISLIKRKGKENNNFIDDHLNQDNIPITNNNRAEYIWRHYLSPAYKSMMHGIKNYPNLIHLVEYDKLVSNPQEELNKIYKFLEIPPHQNTFSNIENKCAEEKDEEWGLIGLHDIRQTLSKISENPIDVIGEENVELYSKFDIDGNF